MIRAPGLSEGWIYYGEEEGISAVTAGTRVNAVEELVAAMFLERQETPVLKKIRVLGTFALIP